MTTKNMIIRTAGALLVVASVSAATPANAATFGAVVEKVLMSQQSGPVAKLKADRKRQLVACVTNVLAGLPGAKKRYITEASTLDQMQDRFGEVVMENRAEWKQKIAKSCASIAMA